MGAKPKTSPWLTPYYSFRAQEYALRVIKGISREAAARQHMRQNRENEKNDPQTLFKMIGFPEARISLKIMFLYVF